jgi:hypothetical protein
LDQNQDNEDNRTDNQVTAADELTEYFYYFTGVAVGQDISGRLDVQTGPEDGRKQKDGREKAHVQDFFGEHTTEHDGKGNRDVDGK